MGLRNAFDTDHISAIDDTTRSLPQKSKRPLALVALIALATPRHSHVATRHSAQISRCASGADSWTVSEQNGQNGQALCASRTSATNEATAKRSRRLGGIAAGGCSAEFTHRRRGGSQRSGAHLDVTKSEFLTSSVLKAAGVAVVPICGDAS
jgi:hypothetical protein